MKIKIAVVFREHDSLSLVRYRNSVMQELQYLGVFFIPFAETAHIPAQCDLVWEPGIAGNRVPARQLWSHHKPVVLTIHGAAPFAVKWNEYFSDIFEAVRVRRANRAALLEWPWFRNKISAVIAVSKFGANEVSRVYDLPPEIITPIYHGVDSAIFFPRQVQTQTKAFFLHVSAYQPVKNLGRLIDAYNQLPVATRPELIIVAPGFKSISHIAGLRVIDRPLASGELGKLYNKALGFVFPSLRESFGLPIIEAMACGCPVITSFDTACAEVAGDAALLVNPRATDDIARAMYRLINEPDLRDQLSKKGLTRASQFTWAETARLHLSVFGSVLNMKVEPEKKATASTCIIVLGMHRSGTSALTGVLSLLGIQPGENLLPAMEDVNPKGFWEHAEIVAIHDRLLAALNSSWSDESPLPEQWWLLPQVAPFQKQIISVLRKDFSTLPIWLIKDPRMCRLLPMWKNIFREFNCKPLFVLSLRHPAEVASSLKKRDGLPEASACLLWLTHMLEAEYQTRGYERAIISYEHLLSAPLQSVEKISQTLHFDWPVSLEAASAQINIFLDPAMRHHTDGTTLPNHPVCTLAQEGFRLLSKQSPDPLKLDSLHAQTTEMSTLLAPWLTLMHQMHHHDRTQRDKIFELGRLVEKQASQSSLLHAEIMRVKSSASWQITKPLRLIANLPRILKNGTHLKKDARTIS
jgi:glycosyltransferase involved in cell wall biosynthesis